MGNYFVLFGLVSPLGCLCQLDVNVVFSGEVSRLVVADSSVRTFNFRGTAVYPPSDLGEWRSFFPRLEPFLACSERLVLVGIGMQSLIPN